MGRILLFALFVAASLLQCVPAPPAANTDVSAPAKNPDHLQLEPEHVPVLDPKAASHEEVTKPAEDDHLGGLGGVGDAGAGGAGEELDTAGFDDTAPSSPSPSSLTSPGLDETQSPPKSHEDFLAEHSLDRLSPPSLLDDSLTPSADMTAAHEESVVDEHLEGVHPPLALEEGGAEGHEQRVDHLTQMGHAVDGLNEHQVHDMYHDVIKEHLGAKHDGKKTHERQAVMHEQIDHIAVNEMNVKAKNHKEASKKAKEEAHKHLENRGLIKQDQKLSDADLETMIRNVLTKEMARKPENARLAQNVKRTTLNKMNPQELCDALKEVHDPVVPKAKEQLCKVLLEIHGYNIPKPAKKWTHTAISQAITALSEQEEHQKVFDLAKKGQEEVEDAFIKHWLKVKGDLKGDGHIADQALAIKKLLIKIKPVDPAKVHGTQDKADFHKAEKLNSFEKIEAAVVAIMGAKPSEKVADLSKLFSAFLKTHQGVRADRAKQSKAKKTQAAGKKSAAPKKTDVAASPSHNPPK